MFDPLIVQLEGQSSLLIERPEGVAFFKAAKDLYRLADVTYVCANLRVSSQRKHFTHCFYSDTRVKQFASQVPLRLSLPATPSDISEPVSDDPNCQLEPPFDLVLPLAQRYDETAVFKLSADMALSEWRRQRSVLMRECRILANYFHSHVLRINGYDSERELLVSARELDCLKWTAAGKTAWEASVILGISERTVRFHLNAAREKLKCANTTQAVAKAIANQLIDPG
jgi:DNA-binding CsgD family transcriptional regulator